MKSKLLPILLFLLILLNGVLIFMLVKKTHEKRVPRPERNFLIEQLQFSESQTKQFKELDKIHRGFMLKIDNEVRDLKDVLFNSLQKENFNVDSLTSKIGLLEAKKDSEVFNFFKKVRSLCNSEQLQNFDKIIEKALRGGDRRLPIDGRNPPPGNDGMPPPPR
ncbi:hypothetical protein [Polaribacter sp. Hel1_85]|uniref:hypothetical protein n=1 Tax=Polaribacter sp. Hel1_85 TaxID=1250005 RepID=UPI00052C27E6|nr:hypothetical protein [Polaribacter sp. Hel1_85]KGL63678.1 hypothetical protein PHEL85_0717 [Polaribacter sp. Hel1_85]